jgi:uncharacterized membrane protein YhaH (DUF805 family)
MSEVIDPHNPYAAPRAEVADVYGDDAGVQPLKLWSGKGRIGRLRFLAWMFYSYLLVILVSAVLGGIVGFAGLAGGDKGNIAIAITTAIAVIPYLVFYVLAAIQRTHDMDWSAWMLLLALIPFVALIWVFKPGTKGVNRFGAPPPPNGLGVKIGGLFLPVIFVVGMLVAIALPAYQSYGTRAKAAQLVKP